jgi:hypothetical protein
MRAKWTFAAAALVAAVGLTACGDDDAPSSTRVAEGTAHLASPHGQQTVKIHAVRAAGAVSGTIEVSSEQGTPFAVDVQCAVEREGALMVGGAVSDGDNAGTHAAAIIRQGDPDRMVMWFEDPPPADDCGAFLAAIPPGLVADLQPIDGDIETG